MKRDLVRGAVACLVFAGMMLTGGAFAEEGGPFDPCRIIAQVEIPESVFEAVCGGPDLEAVPVGGTFCTLDSLGFFKVTITNNGDRRSNRALTLVYFQLPPPPGVPTVVALTDTIETPPLAPGEIVDVSTDIDVPPACFVEFAERGACPFTIIVDPSTPSRPLGQSGEGLLNRANNTKRGACQ